MPRILNKRLKAKAVKPSAENVDCYSYTYLLLKEAGICTTCKYRFADVRNLCRRCYQYMSEYTKNRRSYKDAK